METAIYVTGAKVSCKTRHKDNRHDRIVEFEKTQINKEYWGDSLAKDKVRNELHKLGFNSRFSVIEWIH
ncbi:MULTISPECIES: hypothetical protein [unclassified Vibrio]|uniref:hypothetical protein n=1 Tax=unclassified Vibrio TaxID=2614977 RepID=UPI002963D2E3|nr:MULTISPECIES: hypothetical protein [unclassified Vibrio]MDW1584228.1 hypothetical protein [Vibrio sp. Vb2897]MDW1642446.1 hypothetical protein [Vibrio sp. Vb2896]